MKVEEFSIPMPWGHIAVKAWGDPSNKPILVSHGRLDNAGSFDGLIPLLPSTFYYICIDQPGHGRSSHLPPFFPIITWNYVLIHKMVLDYFKRGKYILMGHSFGANIGSLIARIYPEYVEKLIGIDPIIQPVPVENFREDLRRKFDIYLSMYEKHRTGKRPTYSEEEALEKIKHRVWEDHLPAEAATNLARRILEPAGNGRYYLSTDQRLKTAINPVCDLRYIMETLRLYPVTCPYLLILGKQTKPGLISPLVGALEEIKNWKKTRIQWVDGGHDVHIVNPGLVAPLIAAFLLESESKL